MKTLTDEQRDEAAQLVLEGELSYAAIGKRYGVSAEAISSLRTRHPLTRDIPRRKPGRRRADAYKSTRLVALISAGLTIHEAADHVGMNKHTADNVWERSPARPKIIAARAAARAAERERIRQKVGKLINTGLSLAEIGARIGIDDRKVSELAKTFPHYLKNNKIPPEKMEKAMSLIREGWTGTGAARHIGVTVRTVTREWAKRSHEPGWFPLPLGNPNIRRDNLTGRLRTR